MKEVISLVLIFSIVYGFYIACNEDDKMFNHCRQICGEYDVSFCSNKRIVCNKNTRVHIVSP